MNDQAPGPNLAATLKMLWPYLPGVAGAVLSMAIAEKLSMKGKVLSLACGIAASVWLAPMAAAMLGLIWPAGAVSAHVLGGLGLLCGLSGMALFTGLIEFAGRFGRNPLGMLKVKLGPVDIDGSRG